MTLPALVQVDGVDSLPIGRHRCSLVDLHARYVAHADFSTSSTRAAIWDEFQDALDLLRSAVRVHALWVSGSFLSGKMDPNDVDVLFVINARDYARCSDEDKAVVSSFETRVKGPLGEPVPAHGLTKVDTFLLHWRAWGEFHPQGPGGQAEYCSMRGYWDDFWARTRQSPKGQPITWPSGIPRRGYVEVDLDAYDR